MALRGKPDFHNLKPLPYIGWRFKKTYCSVKRYNEAKREYIVTWISEYGPNRCLTDKELQSTFKVLLDLQVLFLLRLTLASIAFQGGIILLFACTSDTIYQKTLRSRKIILYQ